MVTLSAPEGAILGAVVRGDGVEIPAGNTVLGMDDRGIIFLMADAGRPLRAFSLSNGVTVIQICVPAVY